ncbi:unnamed protein product [Porites evermanni]|uniref:Sigma non-opioid intracellular receptor 1 n=1 Tax=Porites evermanni TaxID=104178 RepID=A0ABN8N3I3_9CNID|nr:unnamed protein product [Porites evermanni]
MSVLTYVVLVCFAIFGIQYWLKNKSYIFQAKDIEKIARHHVGKDKSISATFSNIALEIERKYPGHVLPEEVREWLFINAGGWMGSMYVLHASLTEYVLFFGTALDTQGHSGRYWANISDTILTGSYRQWSEGRFGSRVYSPGETVYHTWGDVTAMHWTAGTWMVEYGRGFIPSTLGFALADSIFSTTDFIQIFKIARMYARALVQETLFQVFEFIEMMKK